MGTEIERKFLVDYLPDLEKVPHKEIVQGYIAATEDDLEVRLRRSGDSFFHTIKRGTGQVRDEFETDLSKQQFDALWPATEGKRLEKSRFELPHDGRIIELDVYHGNLEGLVVAEVEFDSEEASKKFVVPDWFGREVTFNSDYKNKNLALHGIPAGYQKTRFEYDLDVGLAKLIHKIESKLKSKFPTVVLIAGGSSSGKTKHVAARVKEAFGDDAVIISMDDYYKGNKYMEEQRKLGNILNWDMPEAIDIELLRQHLQQLKAGQSVQKPIYNFKTGEREEGPEEIKPKKVIIVEGLFTLDNLLAPEGDVRAFVDIGTHGRILRRLLRDVERTGQKPVDILRYFAEVVEPMHRKYVDSTKANADIVIRNEYRAAEEAQRANAYEVQLKFKAQPDSELLRKQGAEQLSSTTQTDRYYSPNGRNLSDSGEMLRIRRENNRLFLTYKGPFVDSGFRKRPKFEFEIDEETEKRFLEIYGSRTAIIRKNRTMYQMNDVIFSLDEVFRDGVFLGTFVEFRGKDIDETKMSSVLEKLGLKREDGIKTPYVALKI